MKTGNRKNIYEKDLFTDIYMNLHCMLGYINIDYLQAMQYRFKKYKWAERRTMEKDIPCQL